MDEVLLLARTDTAGIAVAVLAILGLAMPVAIFRGAKSWAGSQPELAPQMLLSATVVSVVGILVAGLIALALIGWLPPPTHWFGSSSG
ncbi:MAG: hypothetical protein U1E76_09230 [Planctomycetota bacterium]